MRLTAEDIREAVFHGEIDGNSEWVRVEPKRYLLVPIIDVELNCYEKYLNYDKTNETYVISNKVNTSVFKTEFTNEDIKRLGIPIGQFRKIEVELEV